MVSPEVLERDRSAHLPSWPIVLLIVGLAALYLATQGWRDRHLFLINATESLPNWAFVVERGTSPVRGKLAFFVVPRTPLIVAHFGKEPQPFGKTVYGMPGDIVTRADNWVSVNGARVAHLKALSKRGEPLAPGPLGRVPQDCYFMGSPHPDGFDSRYADIGWVCDKQIVGTGTTVL
ncbi:MAG: S26 family signal peptidase [Sphingomonadaceae bacterium]|nr:S26 family signal peptidase [Sphingomonadaceae bacterium]